MATYYRWRQSTVKYVINEKLLMDNSFETYEIPVDSQSGFGVQSNSYKLTSNGIELDTDDPNYDSWTVTGSSVVSSNALYQKINNQAQNLYEAYKITNSSGENVKYSVVWVSSGVVGISGSRGSRITVYGLSKTSQPDTFSGYVYSTTASAYPNGGVQDGYYYDQRTTITSPTAPTNLTYPSPINAPQVSVSWEAAISNTNYPVSVYQLQYSTNNGSSWSTVSSSIEETSRTVTIPVSATQVRFRVRAQDSNGQWGDYKTGNNITVSILPATPGNLYTPATVVTGQSIAVSWSAAARATGYILQRNTGSGWTQVYSGANTNFSEAAGNWTSIQYRVCGTNQYGSGGWATSNTITGYNSPVLTVPSLAMQGEGITVNWTAIDGATSYTLQRKADTDADWAQVYSGPNLTFTETAGAWTSVQYRVQATFSAGTGSWATSESIPVMSASALVISGSDGDLGTLVNDVPYTISTDTGNPISVRTTVNGAVIFNGEVESGAAKAIPVLDLVNGEGTIVIEASVEATSGTVSAVRTWTYNKALIIFPNSGGPAQLTKEGKIIFPKTLAECVRLPGGRTLDKVMGFPAQVFVGSYTGTGTYGDGDPNEVTVPFKPQIVFVSNGSVGTTIPMIRPLEKAKSSAALTVAWTDDSVSWSATSAAAQMNANGTDYIVVAFG